MCGCAEWVGEVKMTEYAILLDFGSTYTKAVCVNTKKHELVLTTRFPSTVDTDAGTVSREICGGSKTVQRGKNLRGIKTVIGTGGILVNSDYADACSVLRRINLSKADAAFSLLPENAEARIDSDYVLFAAGLLRKYDEECALKIIKNSIGLG